MKTPEENRTIRGERNKDFDGAPIKTVIMAGGVGSRIQEIESELPKPLIKIKSKPILQYELECLAAQGFTEIIITVAHKSKMIMDYFGDGGQFGCSISYYEEKTPLGNAGALFKLWDSGKLEDGSDFLLLNADAMFDVDFRRFVDFHRSHGGLATLFTHPNSHPFDSGLIITSSDHSGSVEMWLTKEDERPKYYKNRVNAGLHVVNTAVLQRAIEKGINKEYIGQKDSKSGKVIKVDLDRQLLKPLAGSGLLFAYDSPEYVKDMGTPKRFTQVTKDLNSGLVSARNLNVPQKAIFLDRDGTINRFVGFLRDPQSFELLPGVSEAIELINQSGFLCIVITNQPVIARGEVTEEGLQTIHDKMETILGQAGAYIDALYYCPHHPDKGFVGEITELKTECNCRKPKPGLLLQAARDYNINLKNSWMIGDGWRDIEAGKNAGTHTALLTGEGTENYMIADQVEGHMREATPDIEASDLLGAVKKILHYYESGGG